MLRYRVVPSKHPKTKTTIYYAREVPGTPIQLKEVCAKIVDRTALSSADVKSCVDALQAVVMDEVARGNSVRLGDLGSFRLSLSSASVADANDWTPLHIKGARVVFTASTTIKQVMRSLNYERVDKTK